MKRPQLLLAMHDAMLAALGPSRWWPGDTPFEVAVGAVLTQNTNWKNVEKAIANLRAAGALEARAMDALPAARLAELVRPSGSFNVKAARLKNLLALLRDEADYDIRALSGRGLDALRPLLLGVRGVGPETADSILLYALDEPTFVVDAYTRRILGRHALLPEDAHYDEVREFFMDALPRDAALFNEYHALLVRVAKDFCRKARPLCDGCPLEPFLER
ncbi:endonuclease III domain-containing protein [Desulfocurvus sp.]|jgi:endonuclease-3 related protein|uniref:endonuclease III domain-containing protein n=1 Tax=Desulfocurvus sp. TaxID=2871698 RepID=UPI0025C0A9DE|nr:endonuclease III domain-containing protein [Desulfocurvus sp.]MCK9241152.1 endonuclease III domain-containing protein [Desulfocurvus sp.]